MISEEERKREVEKEQKVFEEVMKALTQDGVSFYNAERIIQRVEVKLHDQATNFLNSKSAKEVWEINEKTIG